MKHKLKNFLIFLIILTTLTLAFSFPVYGTAPMQGNISVKDEIVNSQAGVYKLVFSVGSTNGFKGFSTKFSFDNTKIQPVDAYSFTDVSITNDSIDDTSFITLAETLVWNNKFGVYNEYEIKSIQWKILSSRTAFKFDLSTSSSVSLTSDLKPAFEFYFKIKESAELDSQTFRFEKDYIVPNSFLYAYISNISSYGTSILDTNSTLGNSFYGKADGTADTIGVLRNFTELDDLNNKPPLSAPSVVLTENPNGGLTATITDSINISTEIEAYTVQLFNGEGSSEIGSTIIIDKTLKTVEIPLSTNVNAGNSYTAKVKTEALENSEYSDSSYSALCAPATANYLPLIFNYTGGIIPAWKVGQYFEVDFSQYVTGGKTPYTYTVPFIRSDVSLDSNTGILSGTPLSIGNSGGFTVTVTDAQSPAKTDSESISYAGILKGDPLAFSGTPIPAEKTYGDTTFDLGLTYDGLTSNVSYALVGADDAGTLSGKTITITKAGVIVVQATGTSANYETKVSQYTIIVQPKPILVTADSGLSKVYGTVVDPTFTYTYTPLVGSDAFTGTLSRVAGENANAYDITIGNLALNSNYILTFVSKPFEVTPLELTYTLSANNKVYNGTPVGSGTVSLTNKIGSDDVSASGTFTFANAEVENGKVVTVSGLNLSGAKAGNYTITDPSSTLNANITPLELTYTLSASNKVYNGTLVGSGTVSLTNKIGSDDVSASVPLPLLMLKSKTGK